MKIILLSFALALSRSFAATAPDSITNKVFHETGNSGAREFRTHWEFSIIFDAAGRYSFVRFYSSSSVGSTDMSPPADGTYTYTRTSDTAATLTLKEPGGRLKWAYGATGISPTSVTIPLTFTSPTTGDDALGFFGAFALTDRDANRSAPAINVSLRGAITPGRSLIAGFVIPAGSVIPGAGFAVDVDRDVLIRVVGPGLAKFGVPATWATPGFRIMKSDVANSFGSASSGLWTQFPSSIAGFQKIFDVVGAFSLPSDSKDAVTVIRLSPGAYTVVCDLAAADPGGEALIELYFLP